MLLQFTVSNYRSFRDPATLSLVATREKSRDSSLDDRNTFVHENGPRLLRTAAIYGANASGKSNLVAALSYLRRFVIGSASEFQADYPTGVEPFLLSDVTNDQPSRFETVFLIDGVQHRYGFEASPSRVISEWLYRRRTVREERLFVREDTTFRMAPAFRKEGKDITERTRRNALFLSVAAQFNGPIASAVVRWFRSVQFLGAVPSLRDRRRTEELLTTEERRDEVLRFVSGLDLAIRDVIVEPAPLPDEALGSDMASLRRRAVYTRTRPTSVKTVHRKYDHDGLPSSTQVFDLDQHESDGTRKLLQMTGPILGVLREGGVLVVDELDARLHHLITRAIIDLFDSETTNPKNAQLVFTTQDVGLLTKERFRRDQVWFTEKDTREATHLISLAEYKVRNDASYGKDYLAGRYGGIPFIQGLEEALSDTPER